MKYSNREFVSLPLECEQKFIDRSFAARGWVKWSVSLMLALGVVAAFYFFG